MKEMLKNAGILIAITVIAGFILGAVYQITKEPIAQAEEKAAMEAYKEVFADASDFTETEVSAKSVLAEGGYGATDIDKVLEAKGTDGTLLGYVLVITNHEGYGGDIQFTLGISADGTTNGISILSISETPGLGMEAENVLKPQFAGKNVEQFIYTKTGAVSEEQIDAISGATITTNAVTNGVNAGLYYFRTVLEGGMADE
ncbi:MAG: RnfABCDGE type electron transport complex subunit G [Lachnospiraceae bacterium]|nr:RnfABCDGE type electron transport complex subunit G [Lachnospiraceae bacterium]